MKSKQRGSSTIIGLAVIGAVILMGIWFASIHNTVVRQEAGIVGANKSRQATLNSISQKVREAIGVKNMNVEDIRKTVNEQIATRAGDGGLKATMLFLREQNIAPSQELAMKIVQLIDQGRDKFEAEEKLMTDRKTVSCAYQGQVPNKWVIGLLGSATLPIGCGDGEDKYPPLMNASTKKAFDTGEDQGLYEIEPAKG